MKLKDFKGEYGFRFLFGKDAASGTKHMVIDVPHCTQYLCIVNLDNGKVFMYPHDDAFLEEEIYLFRA